jgi:hypothetical protein
LRAPDAERRRGHAGEFWHEQRGMAGVYGGCERPCVSRVKTLQWSVLSEQRARTPARPEGGEGRRT